MLFAFLHLSGFRYEQYYNNKHSFINTTVREESPVTSQGISRL